MSLAADASGQPLPATLALIAWRRALLHGRLPLYLACTSLALVVNYLFGKEMAWDTLNYHMYAGFAGVHDRLKQDYFAAGPQSYVNPYAYAPFYALVSSGLPALLIASVLAALHSVILWLTFELALVVFPAGEERERVTLAIYATVLAAANPVLLQQIGSSFADITTGELVLAGWLLLATAVRAPSSTRVICAGVLLGLATALKMTNAVHAIAAVAMLIMLPRPLASKLRYGALYGAATGAAFALVAAPWAYRIEGKFGNPFFPLLNNIFRSPQFTTEPLRHLRFIPSDLGEALWRPFAMLDPMYMVHEELMAPDARYAVLCVLICAYAFRWMWKRRAGPAAQLASDGRVDTRVLTALGCGFALDWVLWLGGSGNSRYFIPMGCVCAVLVISLLLQLLPSAPKACACILGALAATQAFQLAWGTELRWTGVPWDRGPWFEIEVPANLRSEPALYLTVGIQSDSFIAPYLAKDAALIDFSGGYPLTDTGANGAQVEALIRAHAPHLRMLTRGKRLYADAERRVPSLSQVNAALARFSLRVDPADCARITVHGLPPDLEPTFATSAAFEPQSKDATYMVSCRVVPDSADHSAEIAAQKEADLVLDRLEDACPQLFQPRRPPTDARGSISKRLYMNTDVAAWVSLGWVKFQEPMRGDDMVLLGRESDWLKAPLPLACGRRQGHYFARVLNVTAARPGQ
jgi:Glycosyltransferase family 87